MYLVGLVVGGLFDELVKVAVFRDLDEPFIAYGCVGNVDVGSFAKGVLVGINATDCDILRTTIFISKDDW